MHSGWLEEYNGCSDIGGMSRGRAIMREEARKEGNIRWLGYLEREKKGRETGGVGI